MNLYDVTVPVFTRMLGNLSHFLDKAESFASHKRFDAAVYLGLRLAPDMLPFQRQIAIASDTAKLCVARLTGVEMPKHDDGEKTLGELKQRLAHTAELVTAVPREKFDGAEERVVTWPVAGQPLSLSGLHYVTGHALPNFFFHCTTVYALLRNAGVDLGKADFLRGLRPTA